MITLTAADSVRNDDVVTWALSRAEAAAGEPVAIDLIQADEIPREGFQADFAGSRLTVSASDPTGFGYALSELATRLRSVNGKASVLTPWSETAAPAVPVRGIQRAFSNVYEDSPWFHDRTFWTDYLDHIAAQRFNRFHLAFGMHYNYGADKHGATDNYLCFAYPFLVDVDGFAVRAEGVDAAERDRNLEALKFIAKETRRRGLDFQLGLWNHAYDYGRDSKHLFPILGIGPDNHAAYSAAGIARLLEEVPEITGFSFRVHYEGGIPDAGHEVFWNTMFQAISDSGRDLQVDMHAKGVDQALLSAVDKPGIHAVLSGKHWAEHMGLPYHQTTIRDLEAARPLEDGASVTGVTEFTRRFTRYGYGDFLNEDRSVDFMFRMWPGTQRLLLWGDPAIAAGFGRQAVFGGAIGFDYCEPLFFKGRKGSGAPGGRETYARDDLTLGVDDWTKYRYTYLLWGRHLYNPDTAPEVWQRFLVSEYGADAADAAQRALSNASRILPLMTVTHAVAASCNANWMENPVTLPISAWGHSEHYAQDTAAPAIWDGAVPFDSTMFYSVGAYVRDAVAGTLDGKYTPLEVASWLESYANRAAEAVAELRRTGDADDAQTKRTIIDVEVQIRLGRFYAAQFRSAVDYGVFEATGSTESIVSAVELAEAARRHWVELIDIVDGVYTDHLWFGSEGGEHGHWRLQLPAIDDDLRMLRRERDRALDGGPTGAADVRHRDSRPWTPAGVSHTQPDEYDRGSAIPIRLDAAPEAGIDAAMLHYRHLDQSQTYRSVPMTAADGGFEAEIPGSYTDSAYPMAYFFVVAPEAGDRLIYPGFTDDTLSNQPYYTLGSTGANRR